MQNTFTAKSSITINTTADKVWQALTEPAMVKQYLFGTDVKTDWQVGSPITYSGLWDGKPYEDKGTVVKNEPEKLLVTTYWSAAFGENIPENQRTVSYEISPAEAGTTLTITQDNAKTEEERDHSQKNWDMVLNSIKKLLETA